MVSIRIANPSRGRGGGGEGWGDNSDERVVSPRQVGYVTLETGTTFLHINALARLTETTLGEARAT